MTIFTATSSCASVASGTDCSYVFSADASSSPAFASGFSYGEIVITTMLFGLLLIVSYAVLWFRVRGVRIRQ